jgi:glutamate-ammonia-ligase adenylyltransferase
MTTLKNLDKLLLKEDSDEQTNTALSELGFEDIERAKRVLLSLTQQTNFQRLFPKFFHEFLKLIRQSYNPDAGLLNFERFSQKVLDKDHLYSILNNDVFFLEALVSLFSGSQILTDTLLKNPGHFDWLKLPETLKKPKSKDALSRDFYVMSGTEDLDNRLPSLLRKFKQREYIRIGLRDLMGLETLKQNVEDISNLADICLQLAYEFSNRLLKKKYGVPMHQGADGELVETEFCILGMGKLGGRELNYSSDIDLIYIYESSHGETRNEANNIFEGSITNHEYFTKLSQLLTQTINEITEEGAVFRVDLNLRPEGRSGEIANSLASAEVYYQSWGKTWERQALIKARVSSGSETLGKSFFEMIEPFVFRKQLDFAALDEIKAMKRKIDVSLKQKRGDKQNIKLGFGGIREVEFIVQAYQLIFGGRSKDLRIKNTLEALDQLRNVQFLEPEEYDQLKEAYIFLRRLENRVQMTFGLQTHSLPKKDDDIAILAKKMGYKANSKEELISQFNDDMNGHTNFVGNFFSNLLAEPEDRDSSQLNSLNQQTLQIDEKAFTQDLMRTYSLQDPKRAFQFLKTLRDGPEFFHPTDKCIRQFYLLLPKLLEGAVKSPMPNSAVENFVKFIEASQARETFFAIFIDNPKFLEILLVLFGSSDGLSNVMIRRPEYLDVLISSESIYRFKHPEKIYDELIQNLESASNLKTKKEILRKFKKGEELRIGVRYLIQETDLIGTLTDLSTVADIFLQAALRTAKAEIGNESIDLNKFAIFGLGKLGGNELNFGSDLDIIFVYDESEKSPPIDPENAATPRYMRLAQIIYSLSAETTVEGIAYKIDTNLRPEGNQGWIAHSIQGYENYFKSRGRIWEQQAMTRARFIAGDETLGKRFIEVAQKFTYKPKLEYSSLIEIARLRERMEKEIAKEIKKGKNVKLGYGGLADIEFTVQILQLMHGYKSLQFRQTNTLHTLEAFAALGVLDHSAAENLKQQYLFLRNLECALRILDQSESSNISKKSENQTSLAKLLGYKETKEKNPAEQMLEEYRDTTSKVRDFYSKNLDALLRTSL